MAISGTRMTPIKPAAATQPKIRSMNWQRVTIMGLLNMFLAQNARILYRWATGNDITPKDFVTKVAFSMAGYDPRAEHELGLKSTSSRADCTICK